MRLIEHYSHWSSIGMPRIKNFEKGNIGLYFSPPGNGYIFVSVGSLKENSLAYGNMDDVLKNLIIDKSGDCGSVVPKCSLDGLFVAIFKYLYVDLFSRQDYYKNLCKCNDFVNKNNLGGRTCILIWVGMNGDFIGFFPDSYTALKGDIWLLYYLLSMGVVGIDTDIAYLKSSDKNLKVIVCRDKSGDINPMDAWKKYWFFDDLVPDKYLVKTNNKLCKEYGERFEYHRLFPAEYGIYHIGTLFENFEINLGKSKVIEFNSNELLSFKKYRIKGGGWRLEFGCRLTTTVDSLKKDIKNVDKDIQNAINQI